MNLKNWEYAIFGLGKIGTYFVISSFFFLWLGFWFLILSHLNMTQSRRIERIWFRGTSRQEFAIWSIRRAADDSHGSHSLVGRTAAIRNMCSALPKYWNDLQKMVADIVEALNILKGAENLSSLYLINNAITTVVHKHLEQKLSLIFCR